jgi:hypothetical protein
VRLLVLIEPSEKVRELDHGVCRNARFTACRRRAVFDVLRKLDQGARDLAKRGVV